jgi:TetR/AcrR family transcriptional regulator, transcriptional repressor of bet genes
LPKLGMETIRRRQIIDAVVQIIESHGWNDLTFQQVSRVSGISTGVVVHYFGSKREVVLDAVAEAGDRLDKALQDVRQSSNRAVKQLARLNDFLTVGRQGIPGPKFWITVLANSAFKDVKLRAEMARLSARLRETAVEIFRLGLAQGAFRFASPPEQIAADYASLVLGLWSTEIIAGNSEQGPLALRRFCAAALGSSELEERTA